MTKEQFKSKIDKVGFCWGKDDHHIEYYGLHSTLIIEVGYYYKVLYGTNIEMDDSDDFSLKEFSKYVDELTADKNIFEQKIRELEQEIDKIYDRVSKLESELEQCFHKK